MDNEIRYWWSLKYSCTFKANCRHKLVLLIFLIAIPYDKVGEFKDVYITLPTPQ